MRQFSAGFLNDNGGPMWWDHAMKPSQLLECLASDQARLREVAAIDLTAPVPTCPGWTVADLVLHVAKVYLHKSECIRQLAFPDPWPVELATDDPIGALDRCFAELTDRLAAHQPGDPAYTWYGPDQTVGFWIRRMAHETAIHRVDAERALGVPPAPIRTDLAEDGIDEMLTLFVGYGSMEWPDEFAAVRAAAVGTSHRVDSPAGSWLVRVGADGATVTPTVTPTVTTSATPTGPADGTGDDGPMIDSTVRGPAGPLLLWLWNRGDASELTITGAQPAVAELRAFLTAGAS